MFGIFDNNDYDHCDNNWSLFGNRGLFGSSSQQDQEVQELLYDAEHGVPNILSSQFPPR